MTERTTYTQLRPEERVVISSMKLMGESTRAMARVLSRPASTISRELRRNSCPALGYTSDSARAMHALRRRAAKPPAKLDPDGVAWRVVNWTDGPPCWPTSAGESSGNLPYRRRLRRSRRRGSCCF